MRNRESKDQCVWRHLGPLSGGTVNFSSLFIRPCKLLPMLVNSLGKFLLGLIFITSTQFLKTISIWSYRCSDVT